MADKTEINGELNSVRESVLAASKEAKETLERYCAEKDISVGKTIATLFTMLSDVGYYAGRKDDTQEEFRKSFVSARSLNGGSSRIGALKVAQSLMCGIAAFDKTLPAGKQDDAPHAMTKADLKRVENKLAEALTGINRLFAQDRAFYPGGYCMDKYTDLSRGIYQISAKTTWKREFETYRSKTATAGRERRCKREILI